MLTSNCESVAVVDILLALLTPTNSVIFRWRHLVPALVADELEQIQNYAQPRSSVAFFCLRLAALDLQSAHNRKPVGGQLRGEWLHLFATSLTPPIRLVRFQ